MQSTPVTTVANDRVFERPAERIQSGEDMVVWPLAVVILFACIVNLPCLRWGLQYGHDHNLHITYLHFFEAQLRAGEFYPRWISGLNLGAGSPIFFVQYPLPFYGAAVLHWVLHLPATPVGEAHALGLFIFLMGIVSAVSCWLWCRELANPRAAMLATIAYLTMPYIYSCDVYYRAAIGEYSALAWIPLALFCAHQIEVKPARAIAGIALAFAAIVLSNLFTAILFSPFLVFYVICRAPQTSRLWTVLLVGVAIVLGLGISAFYFLPMNAHRKLFSLANLINLGPDIFNYRDHLFPFGETLFPSGGMSLRIVDLVSGILGLAIATILIVRLRRSQTPKVLGYAAIVCVLLTCAAPLLHFVRFVPHEELAIPRVIDVRTRIFLITFLTMDGALLAYVSLKSVAESLSRFFLASTLACYFLTTRWSASIWEHASFLWNIQFPWRLAGLMSIFSVGLMVLFLKEVWSASLRNKKVLLVCSGLWLAIAGGSYLALGIPQSLASPFFTETKRKVETAYPAYATVSRMPQPDELGPDDGLINHVSFVSGNGSGKLDTVNARHLRLAAVCPQGCTVLLKLVYYPYWQAHEGSTQIIPLHASGRAGLTELSLSPGDHDVDLELPVGRTEVWGAWLSVVSLLIAALLLLTRVDDPLLKLMS